MCLKNKSMYCNGISIRAIFYLHSTNFLSYLTYIQKCLYVFIAKCNHFITLLITYRTSASKFSTSIYLRKYQSVLEHTGKYQGFGTEALEGKYFHFQWLCLKTVYKQFLGRDKQESSSSSEKPVVKNCSKIHILQI